MEPIIPGEKYNNIVHWWHKQHSDSRYGVTQFETAIGARTAGGKALDVSWGPRGGLSVLFTRKILQ